MFSPAAATSRTRSTGVAAHEERRVGLARVDLRARLLGRARVVEAVEVRDVVLGHAERALQDQRLEHRGVQPAVGLGLALERGVGDRRSP